MRNPIRMMAVALLGAAAAVLVSCGSSGSSLIPAVNATPLQRDFEAVAQDAAAGSGSCTATEAALGKTEQDFLALPATVDRGLRARLEQGIANLRKQALATCLHSASTATTTTSTQTTPTQTTTTSTQTTPATTPTTTTSTTTGAQTTPTTTTPPGQGGGTAAPGQGEGEAEAGPNKGKGKGEDGANSGGASAGGGQ
jgi:hypothetical protein